MLILSSLKNNELDSSLDNRDPMVDVEDKTLPEDDGPAVDDAPDVNAFSKLDGGMIDCSCDFNTLFAELLLLPLEVEMVLLVLELLLLPLPQLLLPLDEVEYWGFDNCELFAAAAEEICGDECIMIDTIDLLLMFSLEDGGPGAVTALLLLLNEELALEFEENKLFVVLVLELF